MRFCPGGLLHIDGITWWCCRWCCCGISLLKGGQVSFEDATYFIPQSRGSSSALGYSFALVVVRAT